MNPLNESHSGTAPEASRNAYGTNQGTNVDDFQSDSHAEAGVFQSLTTRNSGSEDSHDMVTGVHEEVTYCFPSRSSGKQKKSCSTGQRHFRSVDTLATVEADQIFLGLQQLANNKNSANFHNNINRIPICQNCSPKRCQHLMGDLKSLRCLRTFSKRTSKFIIS